MPILTLKITLVGAKPPIWRRVQVPGGISLGQLHDVIQIAMGWTDSHLHQFEQNRIYFGPPDRDIEWQRRNERRVRVDEVLSRVGDRIDYEYDFGDSWTHAIVLERIDDASAAPAGAVLLKARGACPPEDCGGIGGFWRFLEILDDPDDPEHAAMLEWYGGPFDRAAVDIAGVNARLHALRLREVPQRTERRGRAGSPRAAADRLAAFRDKLKAKLDDPAAILNDQEVRYLAAQVTHAIGAFQTALIPGAPSAEDMVRWSAVAARCRQVREERGWTTDEAARALKVPRYRIDAVERGPVPDYQLEFAVRYFRLLGLETWIARWARAHRDLARRQGLG